MASFCEVLDKVRFLSAELEGLKHDVDECLRCSRTSEEMLKRLEHIQRRSRIVPSVLRAARAELRETLEPYKVEVTS